MFMALETTDLQSEGFFGGSRFFGVSLSPNQKFLFPHGRFHRRNQWGFVSFFLARVFPFRSPGPETYQDGRWWAVSPVHFSPDVYPFHRQLLGAPQVKMEFFFFPLSSPDEVPGFPGFLLRTFGVPDTYKMGVFDGAVPTLVSFYVFVR